MTNMERRVVRAPIAAGHMGSGELLSVEIGPDEEVQWFWSHDRERGSFVAGYTIVGLSQDHEDPARK
jgi:hypothetical protein